MTISKTEIVMSNKQFDSFITLRKRILVVGIILWFISGASPNFALRANNERAVCIPDVFFLCRCEIPSAGRIVTCLKVKKAKLSEPCRAVLDRPLLLIEGGRLPERTNAAWH
jgi:hypothetical protein